MSLPDGHTIPEPEVFQYNNYVTDTIPSAINTNELSKEEFYQLFDFVENDRNRKALKRDYKIIH